MTISEPDVRRLLDAEQDAVLVLSRGRVLVVARDELESDGQRGAITITTRADLVGAAGREEFTEYECQELAAKLDSGVSNLGG